MTFDIDTHLRRAADSGSNGHYDSRKAIRNEIDRLGVEVLSAISKRDAAIEALTEEVNRSVRAEAEIARLKEQYLELAKDRFILESEARDKVRASKIGMLREAAGIVRGMDSTSDAATHLEGIADKLADE